MNEVMEKLNELIVMLQNKIIYVDTIVNNNLKKQAELDSLMKNQIQIDESLKVREAGIAEVESAMEVRDEARNKLNRATEQALINARDLKAMIDLKNEVEKKDKDVKELIAVYKSKLAAIDAQKIALDEEKKNLRKVILDEIKGKL